MYEVNKIQGSSKYAIFLDGVIVPNSKGDKKKVTRHAAELNGMSYKEFLKINKSKEETA